MTYDFTGTRVDPSWYRRPEGFPERTGAGGAVVRVAEEGSLLLALVKEVELGDDHFVLPKGGVEPGEDIAQAALREIGEESGLTRLKRLDSLGVLERQNYKKTYWQRSHYALYLTEQVGGVITDPANYGLDWFPLDALPAMFWPDEAHLVVSRAEWIAATVFNRG